ncbi:MULTISPECIES: Wzz/FepE/Etk N-terminal domain-containing protein [Streptomyces]|uniref:Capsular polysaccharide biosynthesis protein n=1 Tax=Streptomyces nymphaeiformis TaxID=2663842 RepID=A0A7W7U580_9ACTN|nr:Wzz/FepE/Etk N-terminal domain-containing protein [Streptomyces nymphaeiformis]MBB4985169.1 capsular polysaccharide biosynthesis protein [Streptomyces nymphaeiformis]
MSDDTIRLVTIGRILRRRRRLLTVVVLVGALVGYGTSLLIPPRYTTSASVLLPGAWEERELRTQAEVATSSVVIDRVASALHWSGIGTTELKDRVTAKATEGNIIAISGTADTPERAQQLSDQVAAQFVAFAARIVGDNADPEAAARLETLRQTVVQTSRRITELADASGTGRSVESVQTRTELEGLRTSLQSAIEKLGQADPTSSKAHMVVMGPAARPTGEAPPTRPQLIAAGALLFFLVTVIGHLTAARMSRRLRTEGEIAGALGVALLGTVDVPGERHAHRPEGRGPRTWFRRLLGIDVRWDVPPPRSGDEAGRQIRYRRVCARLRDRLPGPGGLLVVVPDGDPIARRAAGELVTEAGSDPALRTVDVSVSEPMVPDRDDASGALVVLSAGQWTAAELAGIAEACADAGHEVVGVVLAGTVRTRTKRSAGRPREAAKPTVAVGADATGGTA